MTEQTTERAACMMGRSTPNPCPFPATEALPHRFPGQEPHLCAFHAATEPLVDEQNELAVALELVTRYLEDARGYGAAAPLVALLERAEADFSARLALAEKVLDDLQAAEHKLMRAKGEGGES